MHRDSEKRLTGNDVFEGYAIDLIKEVAETLRTISFVRYFNPFQLDFKQASTILLNGWMTTSTGNEIKKLVNGTA